MLLKNADLEKLAGNLPMDGRGIHPKKSSFCEGEIRPYTHVPLSSGPVAKK
jgi:hypothetical protein